VISQSLRRSIEQPNLSPLQISLEATYRRPQSWTISHDLSPEELVQNSVTDCSLIASFAVCLNHDKKFGSRAGIFHCKMESSSRISFILVTSLLYGPGSKYQCAYECDPPFQVSSKRDIQTCQSAPCYHRCSHLSLGRLAHPFILSASLSRVSSSHR
jgi:hypothetical protein